MVAGLVLSASARSAHDIWSSIVRKGQDSEHEEVIVARIAAFAIGVIAIIIAVIGGSGLNVSFMVGLAFAVAASANFPALLLALTLAALQHDRRDHRRRRRRRELDLPRDRRARRCGPAPTP